MKLLKFTIPRSFEVPSASPDGRAALSVITSSAADSYRVTVLIGSTCQTAPLRLKAAPLAEGAEIAVLIHPWRIELWADGKLMDEEWPAGELLIDGAAISAEGVEVTEDPAGDDDANLSLRAPDYHTDCGISANETSPAVIGTLTSLHGENPAEGWKPSDPGVWAGDCMPYTDTDPDGVERYHVLYLKDRRHHRSKWHKGAHQWAHLSTRDFRNWELHPLTVSIDDPADGSICTGSWLKTEEGKHYLYYTIRQVTDTPAPLSRSVSEDGYHYRRDESFSFILSERYHGCSARDPKIVHAADGYHMFVTTSLVSGENEGKGCLAHLFSEDGMSWREEEPIYIAPDGDQPECSDYFALNGWYYLIFSHHGRGQYRMSREPFSNWKSAENPDIPCESVPKMALWNGRILFTGFSRVDGYAGTLTFTEAQQNPDGTLRFL